MQIEFEARPDVTTLPADFDGEVATNCQTIRIRNTSTTAPLTLDVSGTPFPVPAGSSWGLDTGDLRAGILKPIKVKTGAATALVERVFHIKL